MQSQNIHVSHKIMNPFIQWNMAEKTVHIRFSNGIFRRQPELFSRSELPFLTNEHSSFPSLRRLNLRRSRFDMEFPFFGSRRNLFISAAGFRSAACFWQLFIRFPQSVSSLFARISDMHAISNYCIRIGSQNGTEWLFRAFCEVFFCKDWCRVWRFYYRL